MANSLEELRALEREVEHEWWRLNGAHAEWSAGKLQGLREMQLSKARVELAVRIAAELQDH